MLHHQSDASNQNIPMQGHELPITKAFLYRPDSRKCREKM